MRVISGHLGWVRSVAVEPGNKWFATGAGDRVIKIWDLASGELKLSLTGHISTVRGLAVSSRHPYLFSCGEDKVRLLCPIFILLSPNCKYRWLNAGI
jgi:pleiotropic regulator 1